ARRDWRGCLASSRRGEQRFDTFEIALVGHLHCALAPRDDDNRNTDSLTEGGVVGRRCFARLRLPMRALDDRARKSLRRLGAPQMLAVDGPHDAAVGGRLLE